MSDIIINGTTYNGINSISANTTDGGVATYTEGGNSNTYQITSYNDLMNYIQLEADGTLPNIKMTLTLKQPLFQNIKAIKINGTQKSIETKENLVAVAGYGPIQFNNVAIIGEDSDGPHLAFTGNTISVFLEDLSLGENYFNNNITLKAKPDGFWVNLSGSSDIMLPNFDYYIINGETQIDLSQDKLTLTIYE